MIWREDTLRAGGAFALAPHPPRQHLPLGILSRLPATGSVVRVGAAAVWLQRLEHEAALFGVAGEDQPGDGRKRAPGFLIAPCLAVLRHAREPDQPTRMPVTA